MLFDRQILVGVLHFQRKIPQWSAVSAPLFWTQTNGYSSAALNEWDDGEAGASLTCSGCNRSWRPPAERKDTALFKSLHDSRGLVLHCVTDRVAGRSVHSHQKGVSMGSSIEKVTLCSLKLLTVDSLQRTVKKTHSDLWIQLIVFGFMIIMGN